MLTAITRHCCLIALAILAARPTIAQHAVGFRVIRSPGDSGALAVWYPARGTPGQGTMTPEAYLAAEFPTARLAAERAEFMVGTARNYGGALGLPNGPNPPPLPDSVARAFLSMRTGATLNAPALPGRLPLVVFSIPHGGTGAVNQFQIAETIAAQGFVVVSGPPLPPLPPETTFDQFITALAHSAGATLDAARRLADVDTLRVAMLDPTGASALLVQAERPRLAAVIAFDEMPFPNGVRAKLTEAAPSLRVAILYIPLGDPAPNGPAFASLTAARVSTLVLLGATHGLLEPTGRYFRAQLGRGERPEDRNLDLAMARMVEFLRAELR